MIVPILYSISRVLPALVPRLIRTHSKPRQSRSSGRTIEPVSHYARVDLKGIEAMSQELHYTSVPRGLKPGTRGFCTVASTPACPAALVERLESLSGYQPVFPPHDPAAARNPLIFLHLKAGPRRQVAQRALASWPGGSRLLGANEQVRPPCRARSRTSGPWAARRGC